MRRLLAGSAASVVMTATFLVLPVYAAPAPEAEPVETSSTEVAMGSVEDPAPQADVQDGTTEPVAGVDPDEPTLVVSSSDVGTFSLVGVTWAYDPAVTDTVVQLRARHPDGTWGDWTEVTIEDADQEAGTDSGAQTRGGTAPLWTGPAMAVEAELVTRSGAEPTDVSLDLVDPGSSPADTSPGTPDIQDTADAAMAMPDVYSRAQWGADEGIRTWDPEYAPTIRAATLHHTADTNNYTADQVPAMMRSIYRYHAVSRGWGDIGYNVVVDKYGRLWEGRYGGLASTVIGAHAGGFNTGTFGVSMLGNYDEAAVPQATVDAVSAIIAWKFSLYGVDPNGTVTLTSGGGGTSRYAAGVRVTLPTIFGHRDVGSTTCPGQYGYARLPAVRSAVAALSVRGTPITDRYLADPALRASLGAATTGEWDTGRGDGHYQNFVNGALYWSPSTGVHVLLGETYARFRALGYEQGYLGFPTSDQLPTSRRDGTYNTFQRGAVYWSPATGARALSGAVYDKWSATGFENGPLGWPTSDRVQADDRVGSYSTFQHGAVYWSPATGAHTLTGRVLDAWRAQGQERGPLGYPTTDQLPTSNRDAVYTHFQGGAIYDGPTGVRSVRGGAFQRWVAQGYETGSLGWPTGDTMPVRDGGGTWTRFQNGVVYESAATGSRVLSGAVYDRWAATGFEHGPLGWPSTDVLPTGGRDGVYAFFQFGAVYSGPTGVRVVGQAVLERWAAQGYERGPLGWPTQDTMSVRDGGGVYSLFQGGAVYASPATGAHQLSGSFLELWRQQGYEYGPLGWPTADERPTGGGDGQWQAFQDGALYRSAVGTHYLSGAIHRAWVAQGWEHGRLGYPTADPVTSGGTVTSEFQGGWIRLDLATGRTTTSFR